MQARCRQSLVDPVEPSPRCPRRQSISNQPGPAPTMVVTIVITIVITIVPPVTQIFLYAEELQLAEEKKTFLHPEDDH
jgi:hypothetical protein